MAYEIYDDTDMSDSPIMTIEDVEFALGMLAKKSEEDSDERVFLLYSTEDEEILAFAVSGVNYYSSNYDYSE